MRFFLFNIIFESIPIKIKKFLSFMFLTLFQVYYLNLVIKDLFQAKLVNINFNKVFDFTNYNNHY